MAVTVTTLGLATPVAAQLTDAEDPAVPGAETTTPEPGLSDGPRHAPDPMGAFIPGGAVTSAAIALRGTSVLQVLINNENVTDWGKYVESATEVGASDLRLGGDEAMPGRIEFVVQSDPAAELRSVIESYQGLQDNPTQWGPMWARDLVVAFPEVEALVRLLGVMPGDNVSWEVWKAPAGVEARLQSGDNSVLLRELALHVQRSHAIASVLDSWINDSRLEFTVEIEGVQTWFLTAWKSAPEAFPRFFDADDALFSTRSLMSGFTDALAAAIGVMGIVSDSGKGTISPEQAMVLRRYVTVEQFDRYVGESRVDADRGDPNGTRTDTSSAEPEGTRTTTTAPPPTRTTSPPPTRTTAPPPTRTTAPPPTRTTAPPPTTDR